MALKYDPEYEAAIAPFKDQQRPVFENVHKLREFHQNLLGTVFRMAPVPQTVQEKQFFTKSTLDGAKVPIHRFATNDVLAHPAPQPAVLYLHGGGFVSGSVDMYRPVVMRNANASGCVLFAVEYRLAPEHPAPAGVEDCFSGLVYLIEHAKELNIDPKRICIMGDSGGGGMAVGVALMARDRGVTPKVAKLLLIYPMLDDRTIIPEDSPLRPFLTWQPRDNVLAWTALLGEEKAGDPEADVSYYVAPARAPSLAGLPPTYVDVGGLDLLKEEIIIFAARLVQEHIEVEMHLWPGVPHGFENYGTSWTARAAGSRLKALKTY